MAGAWVFPGGAVDTIDTLDIACRAVVCSGAEMLPWKAAAVREVVEETGIWLLVSGATVTADRPSNEAIFAYVLDRNDRLAGDSLAYFANWITPTPLPVRFDTRFFAVTVPEGIDPIIDEVELVDARWSRPGNALKLADAGDWDIAFPTRKILESLGEFRTAANLRNHIEDQPEVKPIQPRLATVEGRVAILMPDDPDFAQAAAEESDPALTAKLEGAITSGAEAHSEAGSS
jgi:8-oxo-dGTP pyrophosphatase MutT (NUDIX family)